LCDALARVAHSFIIDNNDSSDIATKVSAIYFETVEIQNTKQKIQSIFFGQKGQSKLHGSKILKLINSNLCKSDSEFFILPSAKLSIKRYLMSIMIEEEGFEMTFKT
jgi:hypothetical protein